METHLYKSSLNRGDRIGKGSYSVVFKGYRKDDSSKTVAIKRIENDHDFFTENATKDIDALRSVTGHNNVVKLIDLHSDDEYIYIIMEYCEGGDLEDFLSNNNPPSYELKLDIMKQCARGVAYIHGLNPPVVHRDIKCNNILLQNTPAGVVVKIGDFGLAKVFDKIDGDTNRFFMSTDAGSMAFRAPEMCTSGRKQYNASVDIYALGLVFNVLINYDEKDKLLEPHTANEPRDPYLPYGMRQLQAHTKKSPMPELFFKPVVDEKYPQIKAVIIAMTRFDFNQRTDILLIKAQIKKECQENTKRNVAAEHVEAMDLMKSQYDKQMRNMTNSFSTLETEYSNEVKKRKELEDCLEDEKGNSKAVELVNLKLDKEMQEMNKRLSSLETENRNEVQRRKELEDCLEDEKGNSKAVELVNLKLDKEMQEMNKRFLMLNSEYRSGVQRRIQLEEELQKEYQSLLNTQSEKVKQDTNKYIQPRQTTNFVARNPRSTFLRDSQVINTINMSAGKKKPDQELYTKFRTILNKLTPQKFLVLMQQILYLEINTEERLSESVNIIFEKAIAEPTYSVAYANACKIMAGQLHVVSATNPSKKVTFKKLLLSRCQTEFNKDKKEYLEIQKMQQAVDNADTEDQKKLVTEEMKLAESKAQRRSLGHIRFIGELFKLRMLTERIMHDCIMDLLKATDEEGLECLCILLSTVGKSLDHQKAKPLMDQYFIKIDKIIKLKLTSSKTRFKLQDLQDLRLCRWKPRRDDNAPRTIEQIHKEAAEEEMEKAIPHQRLAEKESRNISQGGILRGGQGGMKQSTDEHGWQFVGPVKTNRLDPSKMKISKTSVHERNITLGPGRSFGGGWGLGNNASTHGNRFSALSGGGSQQSTGAANMEYASRQGGPMSRCGMSQGSQDSRGRLAPKNYSRNYLRGSQDKERDNAIQAARDSDRLTPGTSWKQFREWSRNKEWQVDSTSPVPPKEDMDNETVERKTKSTIDEYLSIHSLQEAIESTKEIPGSVMHIFGATAIQHVLERSGVARRMTGTLLHDLVKYNVLSVEQYLQGLKETLEFAEDMEIDIPKIWQYLGELIVPMVQDGSVPLCFLKSACKPLLENNKAGLLVSEVLNDASHRLGHMKVGEQWRNSGLVWTDFMKLDAVQDFISTHKLEYTVESDQPLHPDKGLSEEQIQMLDNLIKGKDVENEQVCDWIMINVGESNTKKPSFIRALMTSVCSSVIVGSPDKATVDRERLKRHGNLLQKYMDHDTLLELQALYALQALVHKLKHPPGVLQILFDLLDDEDIISEDAFNQWESSDDPAEQSGKGVARSSVLEFYRWLRESEESEEEEQ